MKAGNKKKLVIVYEDKYKTYASHLMQLIGMKDDNGDKLIGVKDGSVNAVLWDEKKYIGNEINFTSDEKLVFIGRSKCTKMFNENAEKKYSRYGIEYGWLGNRAVVTVDNKKLSDNEYEKFIEEAQMTALQFEAKNKLNSKAEIVKTGGVIGSSIVGIFGAGMFVPIILPVLGPGMFYAAALKEKITFQNEVRKQRFNFAVLKFYFDHLSEFIEE